MQELRGQTTRRPRRRGRRRVVIAGGGVAALEAMLALHHLAAHALEITVVCPRADFEYRPLAVTEPFGGGPVPTYDLAALLAARGARHVHDAVASVDPEARTTALAGGGRLDYDFLLLAPGARAVVGVPGATHFWSSAGTPEVRSLAASLADGTVATAAVAVPPGVSWPLPAYELTLQAAQRIHRGPRTGRLQLITPERAPLQVLGRKISAAVGELLRESQVEVLTDMTPAQFAGRSLRLAGGGAVRADRVIALPRLHGPALAGLPYDADGFIPTDDEGRVPGVERVWAAGDATTFPVKQGGIAAHHADAAAQSIALAAGVTVETTPFRPVLRAVLVTGGAPLYMRRHLGDASDPDGDGAALAGHPFWWPPDKIAGRYLAPFLADVSRRGQWAARAAV